jgi:hypothetical protein
MDLVNEVKQGKGIDLPGSGCSPADIDTSRSSLFTEEDRATGEGFEVTEVSDFNSWDVGDGIKSFHLQAIVSIKEGGVNEFTDYLVWLADREELGRGRILKRIVK